ncbi:MAG: trehalose-phosphatase [Phenylobacterium sp. RIFCSPHIGHO2_01_FULL_69_31]|uniref:trehalose-phosphatase n=1 Tax=Phenylobacterium sp. RIFCSPHIGHO2_01_FULL_69_31 TaxID=1801944 RepID=UPI0008D26146|nr:trehalose-phosphatase [Phenylobacterium sp. RIFCSPHIGHO2_01_FULL_69_31]OHB26933.1 MAG: trehalose-phosphatase [Phenylobacterium sp. RIFCSPHIGHO2_01_FULL_69_31]
MSIDTLTVNLPAPTPLRLEEAALFLDLDGTLAPIAARPEDVRPDPRRTRLLERLQEGLGGRLAVVSGRTLEDIDRILEGRIVCASGVHGLVRRDCDGRLHTPAPHPAMDQAIAALRRFAARDAGLLVEDKGASVALHFRLARHHSLAARELARRIAADTGLTLQEGDMVEELRTPGPSKGDSIRDFMDTPIFRGAHPVFAGDDATDEHGFAEVARLGGFGVLVGPPRRTHARFGLRNVEDVLAWLEAAR